MANHRIDRITEDVKRELTAIFRELKDPRVNKAFLSIVRVEVTNDLSYCTVYISALEGMAKANEAVKKVASAGGYIAIFSTAQDQPASAGLAYFDPVALTDVTALVKSELGIQ